MKSASEFADVSATLMKGSDVFAVSILLVQRELEAKTELR
jgi:hypothetical protein